MDNVIQVVIFALGLVGLLIVAGIRLEEDAKIRLDLQDKDESEE